MSEPKKERRAPRTAAEVRRDAEAQARRAEMREAAESVRAVTCGPEVLAAYRDIVAACSMSGGLASETLQRLFDARDALEDVISHLGGAKLLDAAPAAESEAR